MANYPLFQSALSSAPFPGTMADTSTPTPASGSQPLQSPYVFPNEQEIVANEAEYERQRRERLANWEQQAVALETQMRGLQNAKWSKHPDSNRWVRRQRLGLNGNKDAEPPEMMYQRFQAISHMQNQLNTIREQIRLESQPSPFETARQQEMGKAFAEKAEIEARLGLLNQFNEMLPEGQRLPPDSILNLALNPTAGTKGRYGDVEDDPIKRGTAAAGLGAAAGSAAADDPSIPEPLKNLVRLGAGQDAKVRQEKREKGDEDNFPVLGLFKSPGEFLGKMHEQFRLNRDQEGFYHMEKYTAPGNIPGTTETRERKAFSKEEDKANRAAIASQYPGYEKFFPNFVEKGFTDVPNTSPADEGQKDVQTQATRAKIRALTQGK